MTRVRIAQLGVAQPHAAGYRETLRLMPEVDLVAGFDLNLDAARQALQSLDSELSLYGDIGALLEAETPEAVLICLPAANTPAAITLAARAGCHVYAEKPCARTADEFRPAAEAVALAGVQFATGYLRHFSPAALTIKEIVAAGWLGRLTSAEARIVTSSVSRRDPTHWLFQREAAGGGIMHWLGCHLLDLLRWTTGSEADVVSAIMGTLSGAAIDVEDTVALAVQYRNGMIASLHCAYATDRGDQLYFALRGTLGWVSWDDCGPEVRVRSTHPAWQTAPTRHYRFEPDAVGGIGGAMGLCAIEQFIASFQDGAPPAFSTDDTL
ncbi:MAG: Gfo/Idh/MocA family protein, partial [Thermomicrobiales bacterium]